METPLRFNALVRATTILPDFGSVERDGFWETEAAIQPAANETLVGCGNHRSWSLY